MKRIIIVIAILAIAAGSFLLGRSEGVRHVIEDCEIWTVDCYDPHNPPDEDQEVFIDIDGQTYAHYMTQC